MKKMPTYRLTVWIPAIVAGLFLLLFGIQAYNEYHERRHLIIDNAQNNLKETALQLAHNLEYALANDDKQQAQSHIARFSLRRDASFGVLLELLAFSGLVNKHHLLWIKHLIGHLRTPGKS